MAEPILFIAKIWINKAQYQKFFRHKVLNKLALEMIESRELKLKNAYYWRYSKTKQYLSVKAYYHFGSSDWDRFTFYQALQQIISYLNTTGEESVNRGFLMIQYQATDPSEHLFKINNQNWEKVQQLPSAYADDLKKLNKDTNKFLQNVDIDNVFSLQNLDANFHSKIQRILEKQRLSQLHQIATIATPQQPQFLFESFYHNGQFVFSVKNGGIIYPEIDIKTFQQRPYGASDQYHVIVHHRLYRTDPNHFKKIHKHEQTFYKDRHDVFDEHFNIFHQADPTSFSIVNESCCEDANHIYLGHYQLNKHKLITPPIFIGIDNEPLFTFENRVIYKTTPLNIDFSSYRFIQEIPKPTYANKRFILQDQQGYLIVCHHSQQIKQFRENELNLAQILEKYDYCHPIDTPDTQQNPNWYDGEIFDENFNLELFTNLIQHNQSYLHSALKKYQTYLVFCLQQLDQQENLALHQHHLIENIYQLLKDDLWSDANIYLKLCEYYLRIQQPDTAFNNLKHCTLFSCDHLLDFLHSPLLTPYQDREDFQEIYQFTKQYIQNSPKRLLTLSVLEQPLTKANRNSLWAFAENFVLYPKTIFDQIPADQAHLKITYFEKYQQLIYHYFHDNHYFLYPNSYFLIEYFMAPIDLMIKDLQHTLQMVSVLGYLNHGIEDLTKKLNAIQNSVNFLFELNQTPDLAALNQLPIFQILGFKLHAP